MRTMLCRFPLPIWLLGALLGVTVSAQQLNYTFQTYNTGQSLWYTGVQLIDMDRDGGLEVLVGNRRVGAVEIWKYDSMLHQLTLSDSVSFAGEVHDLKAADLDHNGTLDLVVALRWSGIRVRLNQTGTLPATWSPMAVLTNQYGWQILVADFDGDTHPDVFAGLDFCCSHVYYGSGTGAFPTDVPFTIGRGRGFNAIDINGDGRLDLIGPDGHNGGRLQVFANGGASRTWQAIPNPIAAQAVPLWQFASDVTPSAGDVNGDGYIDQTAFTFGSDSNSPPVRFWLLRGGMTAGALTWTMQAIDGPFLDNPAPAGPFGMFDLNQDGKLDLYHAWGRYGTGFKAFFGDGKGNFVPEFLALDHGFEYMNSFAFGDINRDGVLDVVALRYKSPVNDGFEVWYGVPRNRPPLANAGPDQTLECASASGTSVALKGSGSQDPDGGPLTYSWTGPFGVASGANPSVILGLGTHLITLTVRDTGGAEATDTAWVTVRDTQAPSLTVMLSPNVLWPPNHKMVSISAAITTGDVCEAAVRSTLVSIISNEGDDSDIAAATFGADDRDFQLRAERLGTGKSRIYVVTYRARDMSGNVRTAVSSVTVPHNQ